MRFNAYHKLSSSVFVTLRENDFFEILFLVTYQERAQIQQCHFLKKSKANCTKKAFIGGDRVWIKKKIIEFYYR